MQPHGGICVSFLQPSICYLPVKRSSDWPMLQQRNEPSPTSVPGAITYSIKFVVSSQVIMMNMQAVNFFCHSLRWEENVGVDKACKLIGSHVAAGQADGG